MDIPDSGAMATVVRSKDDSPFMRLPAEIREMIYRPLLIAEHTKREHNMNSREFDRNRRLLQKGPDQTYMFYTAILCTNRRIHEESVDLCRRENDFVCLTSRRPSRLGNELEALGLQMIAKDAKADSFWNISMMLTLDSVDFNGWPYRRPTLCETAGGADAAEDQRPWKYIFCSEELPVFCRLLLKSTKRHYTPLRDTAFYIEINPAIWNRQETEIDSSPAGLARMRKLLEPLRQLHSFGGAQVEGPLSGSYKGSIIMSVCKDSPTALDIIRIAMVALTEADEHVSKGRLLQAIDLYKTALMNVRSCCWRYDERDFVMKNGPFPEMKAEQAKHNLKVRLLGRIALVYLKSGMLRMARIYTERAMDPRRPYDHRHNKQYHLKIASWQDVVYAEVLHVAAHISYTHGDVWEAVGDLREADSLVPLNKEQKCMYEAWQERADRLVTRRANQEEARILQERQQIEKAEGKIQVVCNWKSKGDRLLRNGISHLATSKYREALDKLAVLNQNLELSFTIGSKTFGDYYIRDAINALVFKLQASVAAAYLMSQQYKEVHEWTDSVLECSQEDRDVIHCRCLYRSHKYCDNTHNWMEDQRLDYLKVHYCKAIALKRLGDRVQAVEHMEKALGFDPGDGTVFAQLVLLKQELKLEQDVARKSRARKLNARQIQLRRKQISRKEKGRA